MNKIRILLISVCLLLLMLSVSISAASIQENTQTLQRKIFLKAEKAASTPSNPAYIALKKLLSNYPLYPYLEYAELKSQFKSVSNEQIKNFLSQYQDSVVANRLQRHWLTYLAKKQRWSDYITFYTSSKNVTRQCHYLNALQKTNKRDTAFALTAPLWLSGKSRPKACDPIFSSWIASKQFNSDIAWQRIKLAMDRYNVSLAKYLRRHLNAQDKIWLDTWLNTHSKPMSVLSNKVLKGSHPYKGHILAHAAPKAARKNPLEGIELWRKIQAKNELSTAIIERVNSKLAAKFLRSPEPAAYQFIVDLPDTKDADSQVIRIRAALYHQDWKNVLRWIEQLPQETYAEERWQYWHARALAATGNPFKANKLYRQLATERSYYGFLSADLKDKAYKLDNINTPANKQSIVQVKSMPAVARAREFIALKQPSRARSEWYSARKQMNTEQLMAAAKLANIWGWHDQAIFTLAKTGFWDDLDLRFPVEHKDQVFSNALKTGLNPAWIYGVIRQESAFNASVVSHAGAIGLMQLMPATARQVAKQLKQKKPKKHQLTNPVLNIQLGAKYLRMVLDKLGGNPVLATAAYNAGPHRVTRWLPTSDMPSDVWVELIPFSETRTYVQRVFTYAAIYDYRLQQEGKRLSARMPEIKAKI